MTTDFLAGPSLHDLPQGEHECALKDLKEPCRESHLSADMVEKLVSHLEPSLLGGDSFVPAFLYITWK